LNSTTSTSKNNPAWLVKMAMRDARASVSRLLLFMASIILGIAAVVSIQLFGENLKNNIKTQSKALMGADYIIDTRQEPNDRVQAIIDSLGPDAYEVNFSTMVSFPSNGATKLVRVRGMKGNFPFYGSIDTKPVSASGNYQQEGGALVDATLMLQYDIKPGDSIKVGMVTLPVIGALYAIPGSTAISSSVAPPVVIPYRFIEQTGLLQFGSRKEYQYFFRAPDTDLDQLDKTLDPVLDAENADLDTHTSTSRRLGRRYENVGKFLNLTAFIALLLGCIGIASSVNIYIREKLPSVAVLKCLGATRKQSFVIFLLQIAGIGLIGGITGTAIGAGLQELFPYLLKAFLPFELTTGITIQPLIMGVMLGLIMSLLFAAVPLMGTWYVSPLEVLRLGGTTPSKSRIVNFLLYGLIAFFLYLFSYWLLGSFGLAAGFTLGVLVTFAVLAGIAKLTMKAVKAYFPKSAGFIARQGLLNLFRPNNQTVVLVLSIGLGTFLISTLYFTKDILLAKTAVGQSAENANIIALDVQTDQLEGVVDTFAESDMDIIGNIPLVTMRMHSIKGRPVNELRRDTTSQVRRWILSHEFRTTYRDTLIPSEELAEGEWLPTHTGADPVRISISDNLAADALVGIGDTIVFNIQGVLRETVVGSIRKVDWARMQLNFSIVFPKGVLENAPQFNVLTAYSPSEERSAAFQRKLVAGFPTVTVIDLRNVYTIVEDILSKVSWIINFMAFFSILTGIIVLFGSVRNSKYQRIKESVLLRTVGASSRQILKISALEYLFLGLIGSLVGILLALISSLLLSVLIFEEPFAPSAVPFLLFLPGITLLVLAIGLSNIRGVLRSSPLEVLRKEV